MALIFDRRGRFSWLRTGALLLLLAPAANLVFRTLTGDLGADPPQELINRTGTWGIRILVLALAVTPLRRLYDWAALADLRRMVGVTAFAYLATHFGLYVWEQQFDVSKVASEILLRLYLTIGFVTLLGLSTLAATSTDGMVKFLGGKNWRRLHTLVYPLALLGLTHYWLQVRLQDYQDPLIVSGVLLFLFALRWAVPKRGAITPWRALMLAIGCVLLTGIGEVLFLGFWFGAPMDRVLEAQWNLSAGLRPAWIVAAILVPVALGVFVVRRVRGRGSPQRHRERREED
jgi:sulfoxide reductase heme-binding subunit YedZ